MPNVYKLGFWDWADVEREFSYYDPLVNRPLTNMPPASEPEKVFAVYDNAGCEGDALVIFSDGDEYGVVEGSHCSCYGLEDQWKPTWFPKDALAGMVQRASYGLMHQYKSEIMQWLED